MLAHEEWRGNTDGTPLMHRMLIGACRLLGLWPIYFFMGVFVVPFYILFRRKGFLAIYHYLNQRQGFGRFRSLWYTYLNHYRFGQVIIDRFAVYSGSKFQFDLDGYDLFQQMMSQPEGFLILSCHVGNYELAGYTLTATGKQYNALVFSGEAKTVMEYRDRLLTQNNIHMIPVREDMSHIFEISRALSNGEIVSIPGDRVFGSPRFVECDFFGSKAHFPLGPYALAVQRDLPILAIFVMKTSMHKYNVYIRLLKGEGNPSAKRQDRAAALAQSFSREIETVLRQYPEQWYNYYEFWNHAND